MSIQRGDKALARQEEKDILSHCFPLTTKDRTICFKNEYILIINQETNDQKMFKKNINKCQKYEVPASYTCYVRSASIYFKV